MELRKVVIGPDVCGYTMSDEAIELYGKISGNPLYKFERRVSISLSGKPEEETVWYNTEFYTKPLIELDLLNEVSCINSRFSEYDIKRDDSSLVKVVEILGNKANQDNRTVKIVEIPSGIEWYIGEGEDGSEWVSEMHRVWR